MEDETFDRIARRFDMMRTRRATVGGLGAAGFLAVLDGPGLEALAKRKKKKKKKCRPESRSETCGPLCGRVENNCKQSVNCGSCPVCARCAGLCEVDPDQVGDPCGLPGQVCSANGACACNAASCPLGRGCFNGSCQDCGDTDEQCCPGNVCVGLNDCVSGTCEACGGLGGPCCSDDNQCVPFFGTGCFAGTCERCGGAGEQCCPGGICNFVGLSCTVGTCQ